MADAFYKNIFLLPVTDFWVSNGYSANHKGIDLGYTLDEMANCYVYPIQRGKVVDVFYSSSCGYSIVVQHDYDDGTKRYSAYIHLKEKPALKVGALVYSLSDKAPTPLGRRGNTGKNPSTGKPYGIHLHFYVTEVTTKAYDWNLISQSSKYTLCTFNPKPFLKRSKGVSYTGEQQDEYAVFDGYDAFPSPVARNTEVKQVEVLIDYLYMRDEPNGTAYPKFATKGIYNVLSEKVDGAYNWYLIDEIAGRRFYIASGGTRTRDLLPDLSPEEILRRRVAELEAEVAEYAGELKAVTEELNVAQKDNRELETKIAGAISILSLDE